MDNLGHALGGAAVGRAVADRTVRGAAVTGAIAGNAPDLAELFVTPDAWTPRAGVSYLVYHRGITHSLLGAAGESVALTALSGAIVTWWDRAHGEAGPARPLTAASG